MLISLSSLVSNYRSVYAKLTIGLTLAALAVGVNAASGEVDWTLEKEEQGVQLFTRSIEGSPFLAVKAVARINAPMIKVLAALGNGEGCTEWRKLCKSSEVIKKVSEQERYVYMVLDLPWPVSDRDLVMRSHSQLDPVTKTVTVQLAAASASHPMQDYVRAESNGEYMVKTLGENLVELTWTMHTDLGGSLSPGMINPQLSSSTLEDMQRLLALAEK